MASIKSRENLKCAKLAQLSLSKALLWRSLRYCTLIPRRRRPPITIFSPIRSEILTISMTSVSKSLSVRTVYASDDVGISNACLRLNIVSQTRKEFEKYLSR